MPDQRSTALLLIIMVQSRELASTCLAGLALSGCVSTLTYDNAAWVESNETIPTDPQSLRQIMIGQPNENDPALLPVFLFCAR